MKTLNERPYLFSQLSAPRQALIRLCQILNFGTIQSVRVQNADPILDPRVVIRVEVKLDTEEGPRPEIHLKDFELCDEVRRLMGRLDQLRNGVIESIEVRAGLPRRINFESTFPGILK